MLVNILFFNIVDVKNIWLIYKLCFFDYNTQKRTVKMRTTCHIAMVFDSEIVGYNYTEIRADLLATADPILKVIIDSLQFGGYPVSNIRDPKLGNLDTLAYSNKVNFRKNLRVTKVLRRLNRVMTKYVGDCFKSIKYVIFINQENARGGSRTVSSSNMDPELSASIYKDLELIHTGYDNVEGDIGVDDQTD